MICFKEFSWFELKLLYFVSCGVMMMVYNFMIIWGCTKSLERPFMREKEEDYMTSHRSRFFKMKTAFEYHGASIYTNEMFRQFEEQ